LFYQGRLWTHAKKIENKNSFVRRHGFQHIIVSVSDTVTFSGALDAVTPEWTTINAEATGSIAFGGGQDAEMLNKIASITQAGQLSNMAAFVPTGV
jgi:hypothetical protein